MCGVLVCTLLAASGCDRLAQERTVASPLALTIALPEGRDGVAGHGARQQALAFTLEGLTHLSPDGRALPRLAEGWEWENDGLTLRMRLKPGVTFHDGTPLTASLAADVLRGHVAAQRKGGGYASLLDVTEVRADADLELVFELSRPSVLLPEDLEMPLEFMPGVGTGPYHQVESDTSDIVLERFDGYHLGMPHIARLTLRSFDTTRTAWTSLLRGDVDVVTEVPANAVEFVQNEDVRVVSFPRRYQLVVAFNAHKRPFDSPAVRRALNLAVDRQGLIERVLRGSAVPATGPLWPDHWAYDGSVAPYARDPELAASLLDRAGYRPGTAADGNSFPRARLRFTCLIPLDYTVLEHLALDLQRQMYEIGVDMQFEAIPIREFHGRIMSGQFDAVLFDPISGPTLGRPHLFWGSARAPRSPNVPTERLNVFGYENPEAERLFEIIRTSMNEAAVRSATSRLQRVLMDDPPALFLAWTERARAIRRDFNIHFEPGRDPLLTLWQWTPASEPQRASVR